MLLRAWPATPRRERGDEVVGTMLDVIPAERRWPPPAMAVDLVMSGLRMRLQRRPPFWRWFRYRNGGTMDVRWQAWTVDDLLAPGYWRRCLGGGVAFFGLVELAILAGHLVGLRNTGGLAQGLAWYVPIIAFTTWREGESMRTKAIRRNETLIAGTAIAEGRWELVRRPCPANVPAAGLLLAVAAPLIAAGAWTLPIAVSHPSRRGTDWWAPGTLAFALSGFVLLLFVVVAMGRLWGRPEGSEPIARRVGWGIGIAATVATAWIAASVVRHPPARGAHPLTGSAGTEALVMLGLAAMLLVCAALVAVLRVRLGRTTGLRDVLPARWVHREDWVWVVDPPIRAPSTGRALA